MTRFPKISIGLITLLLISAITGYWFFHYPALTANDSSQCYGKTHAGKVIYGKRLPISGENFESYHLLGVLLGRTYVHSKVYDVVVDSYADLAAQYPSKVFKYAETGWVRGGKFAPHKTHQNGLSLDFMTPMVNPEGLSQHLPTTVMNKFGYDIELSDAGKWNGLNMDAEALAAHLVSLDKHAKESGFKVARVILAPTLQPALFKTKYKNYLKQHIQFNSKQAWVKHDEHYHVDFDLPCLPL